jgi:Tfp pilus assembly protein PilE
LQKRNAIFVELIVVILFFSLSVLLAVQLFTRAQVKSLRSERENHALLRAQSAVECLLGYDPRSGSPAPLPEGCTADGQLYYDKNWTVTSSAADAAYRMDITAQPQETETGCLVTVNVSVTQTREGHAEDTLLTLATDYYLPQS